MLEWGALFLGYEGNELRFNNDVKGEFNCLTPSNAASSGVSSEGDNKRKNDSAKKSRFRLFMLRFNEVRKRGSGDILFSGVIYVKYFANTGGTHESSLHLLEGLGVGNHKRS